MHSSLGPPRLAELSARDPFALDRRVLHVAQPDHGGVARYVNDLARYQTESGWQVHVAAPLAPKSVEHHPWRASRNPLVGVGGESRRLARIVDRVRPDVVLLHSAKAGLVGRLVLRGRLPTVYLPHAWSFLAVPHLLAPQARSWERLASRWTNLVIAVSEGEARTGVRAGVAAPMLVVANPVPEPWLDTPDVSPSQSRARLGLPPRPTVVSVGRLCDQKGQDLLLEAWQLVRRADDRAQLVLVGDGPTQEELAASADESVIFAGARPDVQPWLKAADVVAMPSRWEGMALSMLEALASSRSVVTHHVPGSDVVIRARAGAVVSVDDPQRLAAALLTRLHRPALARREGARGAGYVAANHRPAASFQAVSAACARAHAFGYPSGHTSGASR